MGDIIRLRPRQGARRPGATGMPVAPKGQGATILFFLGVRYERHDDPAPSPGTHSDRPTDRGGNRRKRA